MQSFLDLDIEVNLQDVVESESNDLDRQIESSTWEKWFQLWLEKLAERLPSARAYELSLRLTDDRDIQTFNARYRDRDLPTDVLAFAALEVDFPQPEGELFESEPLYLGDIIISLETAQKQAKDRGHSLTFELAWLAAHGFLHLLGWDHPDEKSLSEMLELQETLLESAGLK
jgi:probable rRNA maturation factor